MDDDDDDDDKLTIDMKAEAKTDPSNLNNELKNWSNFAKDNLVDWDDAAEKLVPNSAHLAEPVE